VTEPTPDLRATGERIEALLDASAAHGAVARERAEELVRLVTDLYGAGIERVLEIVHESGRLDDEVLAALARDDLVASLLLVHGLHPYDVDTRVRRALDDVRPYLGSHGGDVELLAVTDDGVAQLRLLGSCDGCASSSVTLELAVRDAIEAAAPEVTSIEVHADEPSVNGAGNGFVPVAALRSRLVEQQASGAGWEAVPEAADLTPGELRGLAVGNESIVIARVGSELYAYRDRCARCEGSIAGAQLERRLGGRAGDAVLTCPTCRAHFDVRQAGIGLDRPEEHLEPLPLLLRDGMVSVALPMVST
jgi:Fe-S cluster biogenesis protein NfuA/nitrite reductase/ring-hydroxylating ferredoxin subunit